MATARRASLVDLKGQQYQVASSFGSGIGVGFMDLLLQRIQNVAVTAALQVILQPL
jgi:hypothetical protein